MIHQTMTDSKKMCQNKFTNYFLIDFGTFLVISLIIVENLNLVNNGTLPFLDVIQNINKGAINLQGVSKKFDYFFSNLKKNIFYAI